MENTKHNVEHNPSFKMLNLGTYLNSWLNKYRLGTQLNISFALVMLVPMIIATLFSIIYYSNKIEEEAVNKISSDANMAKLIYQHALSEMESLADAYSKKSALRVITRLILAREPLDKNMARRLGNDLATLVPLDDLDMITLVNKDRRVFTRSHSPNHIGDVFKPKPYFEKVFKGETFYCIERLAVEELKKELKGEEGNRILNKFKNVFSESNNILVLTGIAPVYTDKDNQQLKGALIARRFLTPQSLIVSEACTRLETNAALFQRNHLVASCTTDTENSEFIPPSQEVLNFVLENNTDQHIADISRGGSISKFFPLNNFDGTPVGVFMVQASVNSYLRTRNIAIITSLCIFLVGVLLAYSVKKIIERRIVEPLNELRIGTELIADGEYSQNLEVSSNDEIGELTQAFNKMTNDLDKYDKQVKANRAQLEIKVKERTADLKKSMDNLEDTMETLNPGVYKLIESNKHKLGLVYATELVVDICTYTTLNMTLGENMMGSFMKTFFRESHKLLAKYRGVFDKTVGDQIVAIFGIPKDNIQANPHHPFDAVECGRNLVEVAKKINQTMHATIQENYTSMTERHKSLSSEDRKKIKLDELKFRCRIGINTSNPSSDREIDKMRMVMMGAETCVDYTAQGGSIIYAFRLESGGTPGEIGIGENTKRLVENVYQLRELGKVTLKGLGEQNEYRVIGRQPITDNIYPKALFYRKFHQNVPPILTTLIEKIKMGTIQFKEVRKLSESLDVDILYLEHITGIHNLVGARALFAYAVGQLHGIDKDRLNAILLASLLRNAAMLRNIAAEFLNFVSKEVQLPPNIVDAKLTKKITDDLNQSRPAMIESKIISMCNYFDHNAFDRTNLRQREAEVASTKIVIESMLDDRRFDSKLVNFLKTLIIADENYFEDSSVSGDHIPIYELADDPLKLANEIKERFSEEAKDTLIAALSARKTSDMALNEDNEDEIIDITALPEQPDADDMPEVIPDTVDLDRALYEESKIEDLSNEQEEAELLDVISDKREMIDTLPLNEKDNDIADETFPYGATIADAANAEPDRAELNDASLLNKKYDDTIEEPVSYGGAGTVDVEPDQTELNDAPPLNEKYDDTIEEAVSYDDAGTVDVEPDQTEINDDAPPLNKKYDDTIEEPVSYDGAGTVDVEPDQMELRDAPQLIEKYDDTLEEAVSEETFPYDDADEIDTEPNMTELGNALPLNQIDDATIKEAVSYDDMNTNTADVEPDRIEQSDASSLNDKDNATIEEAVSYDDMNTDTTNAEPDRREHSDASPINDKDNATTEEMVFYDDDDEIDTETDLTEIGNALPLNEIDDSTIKESVKELVSYDVADTADIEPDRIVLGDAVSTNENNIFGDSDSTDQNDTDALYEELRKMKSSDMLQIEKDNESDASYLPDPWDDDFISLDLDKNESNDNVPANEKKES